MESVESLKARIKELEAELAQRGNVVRRQKIDKMSSEVVDTNPYRWIS